MGGGRIRILYTSLSQRRPIRTRDSKPCLRHAPLHQTLPWDWTARSAEEQRSPVRSWRHAAQAQVPRAEALEKGRLSQLEGGRQPSRGEDPAALPHTGPGGLPHLQQDLRDDHVGARARAPRCACVQTRRSSDPPLTRARASRPLCSSPRCSRRWTSATPCASR